MEYAKYANQAYDYVQQQVQNAVSALRTWLGPEPQNYYLLADGRIMPATVTLPRDVAEEAFLFNYKKNHITAALEPLTTGRFKRAVPYLSIVIKQPITGDIDLSEWVSEIRANPVPENLPLKQLVTLWSIANSRYVPFSYTLETINSDGEYEMVTVE